MAKTMLAKKMPVQKKAVNTAADLPPVQGRVIILAPDLSNNAMGRLALDLANRVRAEGATPLIASAGGLLKLEVQRQKIPHKQLPDAKSSALSHMLAVWQLSAWVKEQRASFVHVLDFSLARVAYEVMVKTKARMAITLNQPVISALASRDGGTLRAFDRIIVPSSFAREQLLQQLQLPESIVRAIIPGLNLGVVHYNRIGPQKIMALEKDWQLPDDQPLVVIPDCPSDPVIFDALAQTLRELQKKNVYTVMFTPSHERPGMLQRVAKLGLSSHVITVSNAADRTPALWLAHAVLVTGFRGQDSLLALMEAQAMGRPIVAFDRNGLKEILLQDPCTTLLASNDLGGLNKALEKTLALPTDERERFAQRARKFVEENFDHRQMVEDIIGLYRDLSSLRNG